MSLRRQTVNAREAGTMNEDRARAFWNSAAFKISNLLRDRKAQQSRT